MRQAITGVQVAGNLLAMGEAGAVASSYRATTLDSEEIIELFKGILCQGLPIPADLIPDSRAETQRPGENAGPLRVELAYLTTANTITRVNSVSDSMKARPSTSSS